MIVSWKWLRDYIDFETSVDELVGRLTMAGLNLESKTEVGDDWAIDLEVTSNRPDCLGHIGVAREAAVLFGGALAIPNPQPKTIGEKTASVASVKIDAGDLCPQYVARVIRGVKVGPSPGWLRGRLEAIGITPINNVVDATNYVLMECGQPLHAFDFDKLPGGQIIVRRAKTGEKIVAINQKTYELDPAMCVIADARRPVALAGVMGGLDTEIGASTRNVLIEAANFAPLGVRNTARKLGLHSDSSYRFERGVDPAQLDWASRRCCELILDTAGGELLSEPVLAGTPHEAKRPPIALRVEQIPRILGIGIAEDEATHILEALGMKSQRNKHTGVPEFTPPSWRSDVSREIDLIEEVARIHGYDAIPQDVPVPLHLSAKTLRDRICDQVRSTLTAAGFYEAITLSFVSEAACESFQPRGPLPKVSVNHSSRRHENILRQSLVPSLLQSRSLNERHGAFNADLFEIAKVYLKAAPQESEHAAEPTVIGLVSGRSFIELKGAVASIAGSVCPSAKIGVKASSLSQFASGRGAEVSLNGRLWGWVGELDRELCDKLDLKGPASVAELDVRLLEELAELVSTYRPLAQFPAVQRDLNFVLAEAVTWESLEDTIRSAAGPTLEQVGFGGQYRGKQIDADKKSYLVSLAYRAADRTLTAEEVDACQQAVIDACSSQLAARLR